MDSATPMLKQYVEIKQKFQDAILFFRLGDFYEMFGEDARKACGILDVVLTSRDAGKSGRIPMCGIPYHAADNYISKLIKAGLKVAICEQVEDPALAKGLVKRDVIRVITSGTYIDEASYESRYIIALSSQDKKTGLAFTDTASGTIQVNEYASMNQLAEVISKLPVYECIFPEHDRQRIEEIFQNPLLRNKNITLSPFADWCFNTDLARKTLQEHFQTHNLAGFGIEGFPSGIAASAALLEYLKQMHRQPLRHIHKIRVYTDSEHVFICPSACFGLELENLMQTIDHTITSLGRRKLKDWLYHPLVNKSAILQRQDAITLLKDAISTANKLADTLRGISDIEKSLSRISCVSSSARDLLALRSALAKYPELNNTLAQLAKQNQFFILKDIPQLRDLLERAINPDMPLSHPEGKVIRTGYNTELDQLRDIQANARNWLKDLQEQQIKRTGINSLKIGFNQVFGYYIEISKSNLDRVPQDYIRKQTLANAERFITPQLKEFEERILTAESKILALENTLIRDISGVILDNASQLLIYSNSIAALDCLYSLSVLAGQQGYSAPGINDGLEIDIKAGRHPIVEKNLQETFIPNDSFLDTKENHLIILTGPNMAGKSTYIRQTALLVIMAQVGSYIPAAQANIGIVDKIFTRIGAHDEISRGMSTFMVEMSETAGILNNLSQRSLVILDEIGRGTSTFDGLSIAWAVSEYLAKAKVRSLFATHFHELTALAEEFPGAKNFNVAVKRWNDEVVFLHTIIAGGSDDSYGIYVAKLAGIPKEVVQRAQTILSRLELNNNLQEKIRNRIPEQDQLSLFDNTRNEVLKEIEQDILKTNIDALTPLEALNKLHKIKNKLETNG